MENLKNKNIWICWQYEEVSGRLTKVPYAASGRKTGTSARYSRSWASYDEACRARDEHNFDGVGLVFTDGVCGIDIDHRALDDPLFREVCTLMDTYAEASPSGEGQHLIFTCDISKVPQVNGKLDPRYYSKNKRNGFEVYFSGLTSRYFTFTGNAIEHKPVADRTEQALAFLEKYMVKEKKPAKSVQSKQLNDADILSIARKAKNSAKFITLFDEGDISDYGSHSETDLALCGMLAFYSGGNADTIDKLFRQSKLYREKWEREDYRKATIEMAIAGCNGEFYSRKAKLPPYIYADPVTRKLRVSCPLLAQHIRENVHYFFVKDSAKGGVMRYFYDGGVYRLYSDEMVKGVIKGFITNFNETLLKMTDVNEIFNQLATDLAFVDSDMLNSDENIINFQNGILSLKDMALLSASPEYCCTVQIPCDWTGATTPTPVFDRFMNDLTEGDAEIKNLLLQFMGACLSNVKGWRLKKALFMVGKGDTGKSQLKRLTEKLLGRGNYVGIDLRELEARFGTANIYGKRLAGSADMSFVSVDELKTFKKCTGGDSLFAEFKGQNGFEFVYNGLLWFCMNRLPKFGGDNGEWVYNRIMQVVCNNVIPPNKQDKKLLDKMYAERDGIVHKAVMALRQVIADGYEFTQPESVMIAREEYRAENSTVISFFTECMQLRPDGKIRDGCTTGKVYAVYQAWCHDNNHGYAKTAKEFREELSDYLGTTFKDMTTRRGNGGTFYKDYTLTAEAKDVYARAYGYTDMHLCSSQ